MPLETEVLRNGERVNMWNGRWHELSAFMTVALIEECPDYKFNDTETVADLGTIEIDGVTYEKIINFDNAYVYGLDIPCGLFKEGHQVLTADHIFYSEARDKPGVPAPIEFKAGDTIRMWRSFR